MKRLMLDYAFRFVDSVIFLVGIDNIRSQKAMRKVGAILTERRVHRTLHGTSSEFVIFEIRKPMGPWGKSPFFSHSRQKPENFTPDPGHRDNGVRQPGGW